MISELRVRDLATVADVTLQFGPGLNVLTGETGAGKSMIVDALALLLGARADAGQVRPGASRISVEGVFDSPGPAIQALLDQLGLDPADDQLVLRREVTAEGRSRGWVNGSPVTMGTLGEIGEPLVDLHGQHETRTLLAPARQREVLDAFADASGAAAAVAAAADALRVLEREREELGTRRDEVRRRADYLRHVVEEIDRARLRIGEDDTLDAEARRLSQVGTLTDLAIRIAAALEGDDSGALPALGQADRALGALAKADPDTAAWQALLDTAWTSLQELAKLASDYAGGLEDDPNRLQDVERRRDLLFRLKQKHGTTLEAVLSTRTEAAAELDLLDTADLDLRNLERRRDEAAKALATACAELTALRESGAGRLGRGISKLLPRLGLPGARLGVVMEPLPAPTSHGAESVEFRVRLNEGMDDQPLARTASGGELARVMLAIKAVLGRHDGTPTLVFDEVDSGVGGEIGARVGELLAEVATRHQVMVITHLAPVAARADRHLVIAKEARGGIATSDVLQLHGEDRVGELARMLGDPDSDTARRHAQALLRA